MYGLVKTATITKSKYQLPKLLDAPNIVDEWDTEKKRMVKWKSSVHIGNDKPIIHTQKRPL